MHRPGFHGTRRGENGGKSRPPYLRPTRPTQIIRDRSGKPRRLWPCIVRRSRDWDLVRQFFAVANRVLGNKEKERQNRCHRGNPRVSHFSPAHCRVPLEYGTKCRSSRWRSLSSRLSQRSGRKLCGSGKMFGSMCEKIGVMLTIVCKMLVGLYRF